MWITLDGKEVPRPELNAADNTIKVRLTELIEPGTHRVAVYADKPIVEASQGINVLDVLLGERGVPGPSGSPGPAGGPSEMPVAICVSAAERSDKTCIPGRCSCEVHAEEPKFSGAGVGSSPCTFSINNKMSGRCQAVGAGEDCTGQCCLCQP